MNMEDITMTDLWSKFTRSLLLAAMSAPVATLASLAKDLTAAELANMSQASAVRIGCGVSIGISNDLSDVGPVSTGVFMTSALVALAVRFLPPAQRAGCWMLIRNSAIVYFYGGAIFLTLSAMLGEQVFVGAQSLWMVSALIALPLYVRSLWRTWAAIVKMTAAGLASAVTRFNKVYVRVEGNTVTLKHRLRKQTRVVQESTEAMDEQEKEAEECLV